MIVQKVTCGGLREVYEYVWGLYKTPTVVDYTDPLQIIGKRIKLYLHIEDLSLMEYFYLTRFMGDVKLLTITELHSDQLDESNPMYVPLKRADTIRRQMSEDKYLPGEYNDLFYFSGATRCSASVSLDGNDLIQLTNSGSSIIVALFKWILFNPKSPSFAQSGHALSHLNFCDPWISPLDGESQDENDPGCRKKYLLPTPEEVFEKELKRAPKSSIEDFVIYHFVNRFYSFILHQIKETDLISNAFYYGSVYDAVHNKDVILSYIHTPEASINMGGDPDVGQKIEDIKIKYNDSYFFGTYPDSMVTLTVDIGADLSTFLHLATLIPKRMITAHTAISVLLRMDDRFPLDKDLEDGYHVRIQNTCQVIHGTKHNLMESGHYISALDYILYGTPVKFTLTGTVMDFINLVNLLGGSISDTRRASEKPNFDTRLYEVGFQTIRKNILIFIDLIHNSFVDRDAGKKTTTSTDSEKE